MNRRGFGLMEVVFAVAIVSTALLALQATVSGGIKSAGNSVNRRAAREVARAKLEEILAGVTPADGGGGEIEDRPGFTWTARTEETMVGMPEAQTESYKVVIVELRYPVTPIKSAEEMQASSGTGEDETETIKLASVLEPDEQQ